MKIAIITTTYNRKDLLRETIEAAQRSVLAPQEDVVWEHVVYDDGSTDGTHELFKDNPWQNVRYIRGAGNGGPAHGRNKAIAQTECDYILPLDSDDILLQRSLYNFARGAKEHTGTAWFSSDFLQTDEELRYLAGNDHYTWPFASPQEMLAAIFKAEHFIQGNVLYKKELFERVGTYDESIRIGEDIDLYVRFLLEGEMPVFLPHISHLHRFHKNNISKEMPLSQHHALHTALLKKYKRM